VAPGVSRRATGRGRRLRRKTTKASHTGRHEDGARGLWSRDTGQRKAWCPVSRGERRVAGARRRPPTQPGTPLSKRRSAPVDSERDAGRRACVPAATEVEMQGACGARPRRLRKHEAHEDRAVGRLSVRAQRQQTAHSSPVTVNIRRPGARCLAESDGARAAPAAQGHEGFAHRKGTKTEHGDSGAETPDSARRGARYLAEGDGSRARGAGSATQPGALLSNLKRRSAPVDSARLRALRSASALRRGPPKRRRMRAAAAEVEMPGAAPASLQWRKSR
jgi:hypothetical protein